MAEEHNTNIAWEDFKGDCWRSKIDVQGFIRDNYTEHTGDHTFLEGPTDNTKELWSEVEDLLQQEVDNGGVLDAETEIVSRINAYPAAYIDKDREKIVGLQTDKPLKKGLNVYGGIRMAKTSLEAYGYTLDPEIEEVFTTHRKTHNQGVFDVYDEDIRAARSNSIITGLPDALKVALSF